MAPPGLPTRTDPGGMGVLQKAWLTMFLDPAGTIDLKRSEDAALLAGALSPLNEDWQKRDVHALVVPAGGGNGPAPGLLCDVVLEGHATESDVVSSAAHCTPASSAHHSTEQHGDILTGNHGA